MAHHTRGESRTNEATRHHPGAGDSMDAHREPLDAFVGKWHMEGQQLEGPAGRAAPISAIQSFEWLAGEQVLVHRFEGHIGDSPAACVEIISFESDRRCYRAHTFYNNGQMNVWDFDHRDDRWVMLGDWNADGSTRKVRCTMTFADAGRTLDSKWEHSRDGVSWQAFWEVSARKVTDH